jgi:hypothetical protein
VPQEQRSHLSCPRNPPPLPLPHQTRCTSRTVRLRDIIGTVCGHAHTGSGQCRQCLRDSQRQCVSMDKQAVAERLKALATGSQTRSKAARLREVLADVEAALAAGARRCDVVAALEANGLVMSLSTFETTLKRLRAQRTGVPVRPVQGQPGMASRPPVSTLPAAQADPAPDLARQASHDPTDLDRIITTRPDLHALARLAKRKNR